LQAQFQRRLSRGLQALVSYTWSHALDDDSIGFTSRVPVRGNADFDVRHIFALAATYDIPRLGHNSFPNAVFGKWSLDTSFHAQSGIPVDLVATSFIDPTFRATVDVRPNVNPGVPFYVSDSVFGRRINAAAFNTNIPANQSGNFGRNQVRGLGAWQQDFAVRREFPIHAPNFGQPTVMLNRQLGGIAQLYQIGGPRSLQFALRLSF
jgi:hypothetical protein